MASSCQPSCHVRPVAVHLVSLPRFRPPQHYLKNPFNYKVRLVLSLIHRLKVHHATIRLLRGNFWIEISPAWAGLILQESDVSEVLTLLSSSQMRDVLKTEELDIPEGITVTIKSRVITVTGPRGTLTKNVRHVDMDIRLKKGGKTNKVTLAVWQGGRKHVACLRTIRSLINNMITGVTTVCRGPILI